MGLFLFRIELLDIEPSIWRRFFVPSNLTLEQFHNVIQPVMGWENDHLYEFSKGEARFMPEPDDDETFDVSQVRVYELVSRKNQVIHYRYDFGDNWEHKLKLENSQYFPPPEDERTIGCSDGARACPPEDVERVWGYYEFCEAMAKPKLKRNRERVEWYMEAFGADEPYDNERFDLVGTNRILSEGIF